VSGGVEGLFCSIIGLVNPGEEVITFDPSYDCYRPQVQMAGGKTIGIPLIPRVTVLILLFSKASKILSAKLRMELSLMKMTNGTSITKVLKKLLMKRLKFSSSIVLTTPVERFSVMKKWEN
jgi:hypothetical protein